MKILCNAIKKSVFVWVISSSLFLFSTNSFAFWQSLNVNGLKKFVESGLTYLKGTDREKAYKEFSDPKGKFVKNDKYLFVYNFNGVCLANGGYPERVGKNRLSLKDKYGIKYIKLLIDVAKSGDGFAGYYQLNPKTNKEQFRIAYVKKIDDNTLIGSVLPIE